MAKRILAVDDNEDLLRLLSEALSDEGYDVVTCGRSRDAYQVARTSHPDLILLDIVMPGMTGWEVVNVFLLDRHLRKVPIVLMTAAASDAEKRLTRLEIHDVSILAKPFSLDRLLEHVERAMGHPNECEMLYGKISGLVTPLHQPRRE